MAPKTLLMATAMLAMALAGCAAGDDGGGGDSSDTTTTDDFGIGGNATVGNTTVSGGISGNQTGNSTGNTSTSAPMSESVSLEDNSFVNSTVTIRVGGTVTWTHNDGQASHTVTADDGSFDSNAGCSPTVGPLPPSGDCMTQGETYSATFATAGTFSYHCKIHPGMTGTVNVVA